MIDFGLEELNIEIEYILRRIRKLRSEEIMVGEIC